MNAPSCPACHAKFSIKKGVCTKCGLPEWKFVGIEDPIERGKAIARWRRDNYNQKRPAAKSSKPRRHKHGRQKGARR